MNERPIVFEDELKVIQEGVDKLIRIFEGKSENSFGSKFYMHLYSTVYRLCTHRGNKHRPNYCDRLYETYREIFRGYLSSVVLPCLQEKHGEFMLRAFARRWTNNKLMTRYLSRIFIYIDRYHIPRHFLLCLDLVGVNSFKDLVFSELKVRVRDSVIAFVNDERKGKKVDRSLLKNVLQVFMEIGKEEDDGKRYHYYDEDFEKHMIEDTRLYYSRKATNWILECSCPEYMRIVEECLEKEKERVSHYLCSTTEEKLVKTAQCELLVLRQTQLLEKEGSGCLSLLSAGSFEDLSRMFRLYDEIPGGLEPIASIFRGYVREEGIAVIQQAEEAAKDNKNVVQEQILVKKLIDLYDKFMGYVKGCFGNHTLFYKALKEAFEVFCNKTVAGTSTAEILAAFFDSILKKGLNEKQNEESIEEILEKSVNVLVYIHDKDLFGEFHRKKLGRRLLFDRFSNNDLERSVLTKLKQLCGTQFTSKMEGMLTDMVLAKEHQDSFEEFLTSNPSLKLKFDFSATILTTGFWPTYKSFNITLPSEMVGCLQCFKRFYETKKQHRKLTWIYSLGSCHLLGRFEKMPIELIVSTYQAAVLLLFNSCSKLSVSDIAAQLNLMPEDLLRLLHSLCLGKYKILTKNPETKTISPSDTFEFNSKFTDRMRRIRVPLPVVDERKKVVEDVNKDRRYVIDAAIVRIMKSRKVLELSLLVSECVDQLRRSFKPDIKAIKKRTEDLIERDFLERDPKDPSTLRYLA